MFHVELKKQSINKFHVEHRSWLNISIGLSQRLFPRKEPLAYRRFIEISLQVRVGCCIDPFLREPLKDHSELSKDYSNRAI